MMGENEKLELLYSTLQKRWQLKTQRELTTTVVLARSLEDVVSQTFRLKFREIISILEAQNIPYTDVKVRRLQGKYKHLYKYEYCVLNSKNEPYSLNEDDYGAPQFDSVDEVEDFSENCQMSFSERLLITKLYL